MADAELIVCETCGYSADPEVPNGGEKLHQSLQQALQQQAVDALEITTTRCLMSCSRKCNVYLRSPGKIGYVIGDLSDAGDHNQALLDYVKCYQQSESGEVAFKDWPKLIKGKFVARLPQ